MSVFPNTYASEQQVLNKTQKQTKEGEKEVNTERSTVGEKKYVLTA